MKILFTCYAWSMYQFLRDAGKTEIGAFGITGDAKRPNLITDLLVPRQICNSVHVDVDPEDNQNCMLDLVERGLEPWQCQKIWLHTHPNMSPNPSGTDEQQFRECIQSVDDYYGFVILSTDGKIHAEVRYYTNDRFASFGGNGIAKQTVNIAVDYAYPFAASNRELWQSIYDEKIKEEKQVFAKRSYVWNGKQGKLVEQTEPRNGRKIAVNPVKTKTKEKEEAMPNDNWRNWWKDWEDMDTDTNIVVDGSAEDFYESCETIPLEELAEKTGYSVDLLRQANCNCLWDVEFCKENGTL